MLVSVALRPRGSTSYSIPNASAACSTYPFSVTCTDRHHVVIASLSAVPISSLDAVLTHGPRVHDRVRLASLFSSVVARYVLSRGRTNREHRAALLRTA